MERLANWHSRVFEPSISVEAATTTLGIISPPPKCVLPTETYEKPALLESSCTLSTLIGNFPGMAYRCCPDGKWTMEFVSEGCFSLTGYYPQDFINNQRISLLELIYPSDRERVWYEVETALRQNRPYQLDYRIITATGCQKWVWEQGRGVFSPTGDLQALEGFIIDITQHKWISEEAARNTAELRALFAAMTDMIFVFDNRGYCLKIAPTNPDPKLLLKPPDELFGKRLHEIFEPHQADTFLSYIQQAITTRKTVNFEYNWQTDHGEAWFAATISPSLDDSVVWVARDITERKRSEQALQQAEAKYRSIFENALEGIFQTTADGHYLSANPALARLYGYSTPEELMARLTDIEHQLYVDPHRRNEFIRLLQEHDAVSDFESQVYRKDRSIIWIAENARAVRDMNTGELLYYEGTVEDITERKLAKEQLHERAFYDSLTGLPNRALFMDRLGQAVERAKRHPDYRFAVLFLDLDRFKVVNDSLGHLIGDQLLVAIARRLEACLRAEDTVARLGGDEFTILLENIQEVRDATCVAQRIQQELMAPFNLDGHEVFTGASIGIVLSREITPGVCITEYDRPQDLLRDADTALYRAKALGRTRYEVFDLTMHQSALSILQLETDLRRAVENNEFQLHYQPIVSLTTNQIIGFEALLRWQHPTRGLVYPDEFISLAEDMGLIVPMGWWILREACRQLKRWQNEGFPGQRKEKPSDLLPLSIYINLSSEQFLHPELPYQIEQILHQIGLDGSHLKLEIAERCLLENPDAAAATLKQLQDQGIGVCIDDFGTGYSSISYLHRFPINTLKIDQSVIRSIGLNEEGNAGDRTRNQTKELPLQIVQTIIMLAHSLGMKVIAEGVETIEQLVQLRAFNCEYGQGYLFQKPQDALMAGSLVISRSDSLPD